MSPPTSTSTPTWAPAGSVTRPGHHELHEVSKAFEAAPAEEIVRWAWETYGEGLVAAASFQDLVLVDVVARVSTEIEVVFLDTQFHFPETLALAEQARERYGLRLRVVRPLVAPEERWRADPEGCCFARKVEPLARALAGREAWLSGLRRDDTLSRASAPIVGYDLVRQLVKVNPLATWSAEEVDAYIDGEGLPRHPLQDRGYPSIGCWPCTQPVAPGEDPRSGRWAGTAKTECGLHLSVDLDEDASFS